MREIWELARRLSTQPCSEAHQGRQMTDHQVQPTWKQAPCALPAGWQHHKERAAEVRRYYTKVSVRPLLHRCHSLLQHHQTQRPRGSCDPPSHSVAERASWGTQSRELLPLHQSQLSRPNQIDPPIVARATGEFQLEATLAGEAGVAAAFSTGATSCSVLPLDAPGQQPPVHPVVARGVLRSQYVPLKILSRTYPPLLGVPAVGPDQLTPTVQRQTVAIA